MRLPLLKLILLTIGLCPLIGCNVGSYITRINDTFQFRMQLREQQMAVREAELERERTELERLRRAEINEIRLNTAEMVPELKSTLETVFSQKIKNLRLVPDYAQMATTAALFAKLEEQNERIYQEELSKWIHEQSESQRLAFRFSAWRPECRLHGHGCHCQQEPDCAKPTRQAPLRQAPLKQRTPKMPVPYKMEFVIEQDVDSQAFTDAVPGRAPLKAPCAPKNGKSCGQDGCDKCRHLFRKWHFGSYKAQTDDEQQSEAAEVPPPTPPSPVLFDGETVYRTVFPDVRIANFN